MKLRPKVTYRYSQLTFHRDSIEPLKPSDVFRVETPVGAFEMSKADFYQTFRAVVRSRSYTINGLYNYPTVPERAERFLVDRQPWSHETNERPGQYALPIALRDVCTGAAYKKWLHRKAAAHVIRDRKRWRIPLSVADYKRAIHAAVRETEKRDAYTGELLDWTLISKYDNGKSKRGGSAYKKSFAMLPTVDHAGNAPGDMNFRICSWRTNDSKSDLTLDEFVELCRSVIRHSGQKA